ncbi:hypothetical protein FIBSPDRAFT_1041970 [Athelia psychrophila]|uniref:Uncharacterized protein n=1 Tax=Athelia psychrophila TaxID=1759441 RepID=A0A166NC60_9AGAM|nr:hypothetical protein FIBSPDRAFT_1041970 [Fibularhizoctonia sp. CBS 109695]
MASITSTGAFISICILLLTLMIIGIAGVTYLRAHRIPLSRNIPECATLPPHNKGSTLHEFSRHDVSSMRHPSIAVNSASCPSITHVDLEQGQQHPMQFILTPPTPVKRDSTSRRAL